MENVIQEIAVYAIPVLFAITVHEAAHGYVARMFGDNTAYVLGQPLLTTTLQLPGDEMPLNDAEHIRERLDHLIDFVLDAGACGIEPTTIVDLTGPEAVLVRQGKGPVEALGL